MKKRHGFVSNSSSSSFIVNFGTRPNTKEELAEKMGNCEANPYGYLVTTDDIVNFVWTEIEHKSGNDDIISTLKINGIEPDDEYNVSEFIFGSSLEFIRDLYYNEKEISLLDFKKFLAKELDKQLKNDDDVNSNFIVSIEIGDESKYWAALEHGDIFRNCKHVDRISNH